MATCMGRRASAGEPEDKRRTATKIAARSNKVAERMLPRSVARSARPNGRMTAGLETGTPVGCHGAAPYPNATLSRIVDVMNAQSCRARRVRALLRVGVWGDGTGPSPAARIQFPLA